MAPGFDLGDEIWRRLAGQWGVRRTKAFAAATVTASAGRDAPTRIARGKQSRGIGNFPSLFFKGQHRVEAGYALTVARSKAASNPLHLRVRAASVGERFQLALKISSIQAREPRRSGTIALPAQAVTGEAGIRRAGAAAAERDQLAGACEAFARPSLDRRAAGQRGDNGCEADSVITAHPLATCATGARFRPHGPLGAAIIAAMALAACKPPPDQAQFMPLADAARGKLVIERVGCGSCHTIGGVRWPQGGAAPELRGLAKRALIAGRVPNRPDLLAAFVRDAPAVAPGTTMPAMPLTEQESRDVAAYLYEIGS